MHQIERGLTLGLKTKSRREALSTFVMVLKPYQSPVTLSYKRTLMGAPDCHYQVGLRGKTKTNLLRSESVAKFCLPVEGLELEIRYL